MNSRRDIWLVVGLLIALIAVTAITSIQSGKQTTLPSYYSQSNQPDGARALRVWLETLQFSVLADELETATFTPPQQAHLLFMLEPDPLGAEDFIRLDEWVKNGNVLVIAGNNIGGLELARHYDFQPVFHDAIFPAAAQAAPLLLFPPIPALPPLQTDTSFNSQRLDFVPYLVAGEQALMVAFELGRGQVILISAARPFSNQGLKETGSAELILNILSITQARGPVWFDEWHHGVRGTQNQVIGPDNWLRYTASGHALLFVVVVVFLGLILQGRIFGRPVPVVRAARRRAPLEYISAIANLGIRAGHRTDVLAQYHASLKRGLGRRYRLDPTTPDDQYVAQLGNYNPGLDQPALLALLSRLTQPHPSEGEMLKLASEVADWLQGSQSNHS